MPQLATETYVSQIFWFLLVLVLLHTFMSNTVIPRISSLLKVRNNLSTGLEEVSKSEEVISSEASLINNVISNSNVDLGSKEVNISKTNLNKELGV